MVQECEDHLSDNWTPSSKAAEPLFSQGSVARMLL